MSMVSFYAITCQYSLSDGKQKNTIQGRTAILFLDMDPDFM